MRCAPSGWKYTATALSGLAPTCHFGRNPRGPGSSGSPSMAFTWAGDIPLRIVSSLARRTRSRSFICANAAGPEFITVRTAAMAPSTTKPTARRSGQALRKRVNGSLTNQGNRRPPRRAAPPVGVRVDRVVRAHGATTVAKGGQANHADVLRWGHRAHCANSLAVSHGRAPTRDALRLRLRCREDRPNVTVSQDG